MNLKPGEVICTRCNGKGIFINKYFGKPSCPKCNGIGKLNWIENIVGKKPSHLTDYLKNPNEDKVGDKWKH